MQNNRKNFLKLDKYVFTISHSYHISIQICLQPDVPLQTRGLVP